MCDYALIPCRQRLPTAKASEIPDRTWPVGKIAPAVLESYLEGEKDPDLPVIAAPVADLLRRCFRESPDDSPRTMLEVANQLQEIYADVTGEVYPRQQPKTGQDIADSLNNRAVSLLDLGKQEEALQLWKQMNLVGSKAKENLRQ